MRPEMGVDEHIEDGGGIRVNKFEQGQKGSAANIVQRSLLAAVQHECKSSQYLGNQIRVPTCNAFPQILPVSRYARESHSCLRRPKIDVFMSQPAMGYRTRPPQSCSSTTFARSSTSLLVSSTAVASQTHCMREPGKPDILFSTHRRTVGSSFTSCAVHGFVGRGTLINAEEIDQQ